MKTFGAFGGRIKNKLIINAGRLRYEILRPRLLEASVRKRLVPKLRDILPHGKEFWKALYDAYTGAFPNDVRHYSRELFNRKKGNMDAALRGEIKVMGRRLKIPEGYDWNTELIFNKKWDRRYYKALSDINPGTDLVLLWCENRMLHLLDLSYAYVVTKDEKYAKAWVDQVVSWCRMNPKCVGINWRSPMEIGFRLFSISIGLRELRGSRHLDAGKLRIIIQSLIFQSEHLADNFSFWNGKANNHLIAETSCLFAFASMWRIFNRAEEWRRTCEEVLAREVKRQILPDGMDFENALGYHVHVLDFLLLYMLFAGAKGTEVPESLLKVAKAMALSTLRFLSPSGRLPCIGDGTSMELIVIKDLDELEGKSLKDPVSLADILKQDYLPTLSEMNVSSSLLDVSVPLDVSHVFSHAGYAMFRDRGSHLFYSSGVLHDGEIHPGHLHSDLSSFELELSGKMVFVDSGTFLYTFDPGARDYFRSTMAHNSLMINEIEVMEPNGTFAWKRLAKAEYLQMKLHKEAKVICSRRHIFDSKGEKFSHTRAVLNIGEFAWVIADRVENPAFSKKHPRGERELPINKARLFFHTPFSMLEFSHEISGIKIVLEDEKSIPREDATSGVGPKAFGFVGSGSSGYKTEIVQDPEDKLSWYSPRYGELQYGSTIVAESEFKDAMSICNILFRLDSRPQKPLIECDEEKITIAFPPGSDVWEISFRPFLVNKNGKVIIEE